MQAEIVSIGSELLLGQIVDTNSAVISRHLAAIGLDLYYKTTVGDNLTRLAAILRQALERSEVVITTGGIEKERNPTVGTLAHLGQVDVRIAAKGPDAETAQCLIEPVEAEIRERLGDLIFGVDAETLEGVILAHVQRLGLRVAVAELGSAGVVADRLSQGLGQGFAGGIVLGEAGGAARG